MKFKIINGKVPYIMVAGADHVSGEMPVEEVERIYQEGKKRASNRFEGYPICVDNKFFFAGTSKATPSKKKSSSES